MAQDQNAWHALAATEAVKHWEADADRGLSGAEVEARRKRLGENALPDPPKPHPLRQLIGQLADPLVGALLVAALVSLGVALNESDSGASWITRFSDTGAILLIVVVNALLGFFQERRAEEALNALAKMAAPSAKVVRDGAVAILPSRALVPGDLVELEAGDSIPADLRLLSAKDFQTEEAALTGESTPVEKDATKVLEQAAPLADRRNMVYLGTTVVRGRARALVVQTGPYTELGRIGALIREAEREETPLERRLGKLGTIILIACLAISAFLFLLGILQGHRSWTVLLLTAVSLAVAAIPEGLPAITTITLALGMQRMAQKKAIVRKLPAVETLGSATVICSDKTGTLTQNAMTVRAIETAEAAYRVTGEGYSAKGDIFLGDKAIVEPSDVLRTLGRAAALCNTAHFDKSDGYKVIGDPTEAALLTLAAKIGIDRDELRSSVEIPLELPFDSDRKRMSIVTRDPAGTSLAYIKGSPDVLLPLCDRVMTDDGIVALTDAERERLLARNEDYAQQALRVLALAIRPDPGDAEDSIEESLVFVGLVAMLDPPRPEAKKAVAECHGAGIRVVMITGDHKLTAVAIAKELGFWEKDSIAITGAELAEMDDQRLLSVVDRVAVFARVTAEQKLRLVRALKQTGNVVAMTGDGVNDAPALREAQIGVGMGKGGTDVAREASEMVLQDDNFATIVEAVREGRAIFRNIQKFIFFLNSSNAGLVAAVIVSSFFDWEQLTPLQLLWINLVTNGLPALALGVDPPEPGQMEEPPRDPSEGIIGWRDFAGMLLVGVIMGGAALSFFWMVDHAPHLIAGATRAADMSRARCMAFTLLAISPLFHAFNCRSRTRSAFSQLFANRALWAAIAVSLSVHMLAVWIPGLQPVFHTHFMTGTEWGLVIALAALPIPVFEVIKLVQTAARGSRR